MKHETTDSEAIRSAVVARYGLVARMRGSDPHVAACCSAAECCSDYTRDELESVPRGAYLGEGSGAPVRYADLKEGEVIVDLGAGAGIDSFLAANTVGPGGRVHAFDLTGAMVERARRHATEGGYANVSFEQADIEHLPLPDAASDAAISNCVINLAPDKGAVFREIFRVLQPGGRFSIADIVLRGSTEAIRALREGSGLESWCGCLSGALAEEDYIAAIRAAGFQEIRIVAERKANQRGSEALEAVAITVTARKPA